MKVRRMMGCLAVMCCGASLAAGGALAQDKPVIPVSSKLDMTYVSKYVWRGLVLNADPAVQPSLTFTFPKGISYNLWMSTNTTDSAAGSSATTVEHDHTLNYSFNAGKFASNVGYIYYAFPHTSFLSTQEVYGTLNLGGKFSPTLSVNYDMDEIRGAYYALSLGYSVGLPFAPKTGVNLSAKLGYGNSNYIKNTYIGAPAKAAPLDLVVSANTSISLGGNVSLTPSVAYSTIIDSDVSNAVSEPDNFFAGLTVSSTF